MNNRKKNAIISLILILLMGGMYLYRRSKSKDINTFKTLTGKTQGTTYKITYQGKQDYQKEIETLLSDFDISLSTWQKDSDISRFNRAQKGESIVFRHPYFYKVLKESRDFFDLSKGRFDPTIAPLINAWGFGFEKAKEITPALLDSLRQLVSMDYLTYDTRQIQKTKSGVQLDFNAIAQGYSVDVVADFLAGKGIQNYMVEIGGEYVCHGHNPHQNTWTIGIKDPLIAEKGGVEAKAVIQLNNAGLATSGNYEKFYIKDGKKYAHTLDPLTASPVTHHLLSTTVVASDAMTADALATLCLVLGVEDAKIFMEQFPKIGIYLIYEQEGKLKTFANDSMLKMLKEN